MDAYVLSQIRYMCIIWGGSKDAGRKINKVLKQAARFVLGLQKHDNVSNAMSGELEWLSIENLQYLETAKFAYSISHKTCPELFASYLDNKAQFLKTTRTKTYLSLERSLPPLENMVNNIWNNMSVDDITRSYNLFVRITKRSLP